MGLSKRRCPYQGSIRFLCRLALIGSMAGIFGLIWPVGYRQARFYFKGNLLVTGIYCVLYLLFGSVYGSFRAGSVRPGEALGGQLLALLFSGIISYLQLSLFARRLLPLGPMALILLCQALCCLLLSSLFCRLERRMVPPPEALLVCRGGKEERRLLQRLQARPERFSCLRVATEEQDFRLIEWEAGRAGCVILGEIDPALRSRLLGLCYERRIPVCLRPRVEDIFLRTADAARIGDMPVLLCQNAPLSDEQRLVKRLLDILFSALGLLAGAPLMLLIALAVKLYDGGPILYRQRRLTEGGRTFTLYKFRSMVEDAEADGHARLAVRGDRRITPIGRILRRMRLDELPQLWSILIGDMSLVGPRPERPELAKELTARYPAFRYRTRVKAGLTGYAQVYGRYNTSPEDKLLMDLTYIGQYSLLLDGKLILLTVKTLLQPGSAEGIEAPGEETGRRAPPGMGGTAGEAGWLKTKQGGRGHMPKLWDWGMGLLRRYREAILYLFFGGLTTLVNIVSYALLAEWAGVYYLAANAIAWVLSVLFAYLTNRSFVFNSHSQGLAALRELTLFVGCRVLSGVFDMACMFICVSLIRMPGFWAKLISNVVVVILNYLFSKFWIFREKKPGAGHSETA